MKRFLKKLGIFFKLKKEEIIDFIEENWEVPIGIIGVLIMICLIIVIGVVFIYAVGYVALYFEPEAYWAELFNFDPSMDYSIEFVIGVCILSILVYGTFFSIIIGLILYSLCKWLISNWQLAEKELNKKELENKKS